jgi:hypothetical protein
LDSRSWLRGDVLPLKELVIIARLPERPVEKWWRSGLDEEAKRNFGELNEEEREECSRGSRPHTGCVRVSLEWK